MLSERNQLQNNWEKQIYGVKVRIVVSLVIGEFLKGGQRGFLAL